MNKIRKLFYSLILFSSLLLSGCAVVEPWERERLADPNMIFDENPILKSMRLHYMEVREAATGGDGSQGGGCGCG